MIKIAVHGLSESGKSTVSDYMNSVYDIDVFAFAYQLKLDIMNMGVASELIAKKPWPVWLRKLAQLYGAAMREVKGKDYWINRCFDDIAECDPEALVIEDMRYLNEAEACKRNGYTLIKVVKTGQENHDSHPSENDLADYDGFNYVIEADEGDLATLFGHVDKILSEVEKT